MAIITSMAMTKGATPMITSSIRPRLERAELNSALETLFELHGRHRQLRGLPGSFQLPARR